MEHTNNLVPHITLFNINNLSSKKKNERSTVDSAVFDNEDIAYSREYYTYNGKVTL
jgi:carbonic anhydrase